MRQLFLFMLLFSVGAARAQPAQPDLSPQTIIVAGEGRLLVSPDFATITLGVVTGGRMVAQALQANNVAMARVVRAMTALGIEERDIQTTNFSLSPQHPQAKDGSEDESRIAGYQVTNKVTVRVRRLAMVGQVLDAATTAGANSANAVDFDVEDRQKAEDQARQLAMRDARRQAEVLSSAEGLKVGRMVAASTIAQDFYSPAAPPAILLESPRTGQAAPILPGQMSIVIRVTVRYALK
jgi:uncharacterized protein